MLRERSNKGAKSLPVVCVFVYFSLRFVCFGKMCKMPTYADDTVFCLSPLLVHLCDFTTSDVMCFKNKTHCFLIKDQNLPVALS